MDNSSAARWSNALEREKERKKEREREGRLKNLMN